MSSNPDNTPAEPQGDAGDQREQRRVDSRGGDYVEGDIDKRQGTFVERDQYNLDGDFRHAQLNITSTIISAEQAYNVAGLPNPYLGLRAFTAADRDIFAGRERVLRALLDRLVAEDGDRLLFLVGASGSGKSSLARAGLLPSLAEQFSASGYVVHTRILDHPGRAPARALARIFDNARPSAPTPASAVLLLLIDQFEELFSQADADERERALSFLAKKSATPSLPVRIIATLRSDFLPQVVADARFEPYERRKVVVREMSPDELRDAIQRPIQVRHPEKRIEPALLEQLAADAAADAAYLPLLQVTLEDLWRGGELRRGAYHTLGDAIQRRADAVYAYRDYDGLKQEPRPAEEQAAILSLFLDLVRVSLDDQQRDVRWRRLLAELTHGVPQRERLIADLASARLLRTDRETISESGREQGYETVDIVHEALLSGWPTLQAAIDAQREILRRRVRFDLALAEWRANRRSDDYLLSGVRLAEAEALNQREDGVFKRYGAQEFYERSLEVERRRAAYLEHLLERQRELTADLEDQLALAQSQALVFAAQGLGESEREIALLLAIEVVKRDHNPLSEQKGAPDPEQCRVQSRRIIDSYDIRRDGSAVGLLW